MEPVVEVSIDFQRNQLLKYQSIFSAHYAKNNPLLRMTRLVLRKTVRMSFIILCVLHEHILCTRRFFFVLVYTVHWATYEVYKNKMLCN